MESSRPALIEQTEKPRHRESQPAQPGRGQHERGGPAWYVGWPGCLCQQREMAPLLYLPAFGTPQSPFKGAREASGRGTRKAAKAESKGEKEAAQDRKLSERGHGPAHTPPLLRNVPWLPSAA